jgi:hypothetical protein
MMYIKNKLRTAALALGILAITPISASAQKKAAIGEDFGNVLNLGVGFGYGGGANALMLAADYEFDVYPNVTVAPFLAFRSNSTPTFTHTFVPIGAKGCYYFDQLINAPAEFDLYAGVSLGFAIHSFSYSSPAYFGTAKGDNLFAAIHVGGSYRASDRIGINLDLGSYYSTVGIGIYF